MQMENRTHNAGSDALTKWYAVYTRHQHEKTVARGLAGKQFDVFLPVYTSVRQWKDRIVRLSLPLFPGYVFLRGDIDRRLDIVSTPSVHCLVSLGGRPAAIPEAEIEAVRRVLEIRFQVEPYPFLRCGDRVRVASGALAGIEGIVVRKKNSCRLVLSVELLEKSVAVEVGDIAVERLENSGALHRSYPTPSGSVAQGQFDSVARC
jgi:transcription antitermination factor NusG